MRRREFLFACLGFFAIAVVMTWPLVLSMDERLPWDPRFEPFAGSDTNIWAWNFWYARQVVEAGDAPFYCERIFPPFGHSLALHTHTFFWGLLSVPLQWMGGLLFAVNAMALLLLASAAVAAYALGRELGLSAKGAALAGFAWGFSPFFLQKALVHFNLGAGPWMPLALLLLVRWMRRDRRRSVWPTAVGLGLVGGLSLLTGSLQSVYLAVAAGLLVLLAPRRLVDEAGESDEDGAGTSGRLERGRLVDPVGWLLFAGVLWITARPFLVEFWREWGTTGGHGEFGQLFHPELDDFFTPPGLHPLFRGEGAAAARPDAPFSDARPEHAGLYLRIALLALAGYAGFRFAATRRWLVLAGLLFLLAWDPGPEPQGWLSTLYRDVPPFGLLRVPSRFLAAALLPLSLVAGLGFQRLLAAGGRARIAGWSAALLLVFESWVAPYPGAPIEMPRAVEELAELSEGRRRGVVLKLPYLGGANVSMLWQTRHELPVLLSYVARTNPLKIEQFHTAAPDLFSLVQGRAPRVRGLEQDLRNLDVRFLLVHEEGMTPESLEQLDSLLSELDGWERASDPGDGVVRWDALR